MKLDRIIVMIVFWTINLISNPEIREISKESAARILSDNDDRKQTDVCVTFWPAQEEKVVIVQLYDMNQQPSESSCIQPNFPVHNLSMHYATTNRQAHYHHSIPQYDLNRMNTE